jgi:hypothetical protein
MDILEQLENLSSPKTSWILSQKARVIIADCEEEIIMLRRALWKIAEKAERQSSHAGDNDAEYFRMARSVLKAKKNAGE